MAMSWKHFLPVGDPAVSSFSSGESNSHPLNDTLLDADTSSFGFLGPRSFSLSDLTADFSNSSDILESYLRSPFIGSETDNFLAPHGRGNHQGDNKRLDTISEGLNYEDLAAIDGKWSKHTLFGQKFL